MQNLLLLPLSQDNAGRSYVLMRHQHRMVVSKDLAGALDKVLELIVRSLVKVSEASEYVVDANKVELLIVHVILRSLVVF